MDLKNDIEVANTRAKLGELEARYEALRHDTSGDANVREVTLRSLKRYINQFKEEIARYECGRVKGHDANDRLKAPRGINSDAQLDNTRQKLRRLEELIESDKSQGDDNEVRRAERISLKRLINQLKEEIARYEVHQLAR